MENERKTVLRTGRQAHLPALGSVAVEDVGLVVKRDFHSRTAYVRSHSLDEARYYKQR
jgi:hypothetical protein